MSTHCCPSKQKPFYQETLWIINFICIGFTIITYFIPAYQGLFFYFFKLSQIVLLPLFLGVFIGGIIDYYVPNSYVEKTLASPKKRTLLFAVFMGTLFSTCSHGILAISMQLYRKGSATSSIIALLTAAPWANFPMTILLIKFFKLNGLLIIGISIIIALILGLIFQFLEQRHIVEKNTITANLDPEFSIRKDIKKRLQAYRFSKQGLVKDLKGILNSSVSLSKMVVSWFIIALFLATLIQFFLPKELLSHYFSSSFLGMLNTLIAATIIEVCSEGTSILAFELYQHNNAIGNVVLFLFAGVITDYTEIGLIWKNIGKRTAIALPLIGTPIILIIAYLVNVFV